MRDRRIGWALALSTVTVWSSGFIASKGLLALYTPPQIMICRFLLAYVFLWILRPARLSLDRRQEAGVLLLGLTGCSLYFLLENSALSYTLASNVSILVTAAPVLTMVLAHAAGEERLRKGALLASLTAFAGVALVVSNGRFVLRLDPRGDALALGAAVSWAVYTVLLRRLGSGLDPILVTRRTLFWGLVTALPLVLVQGRPFPLPPTAAVVGRFLFLGLLGSGLCFVLWARTIQILGPVAANGFVYLEPFLTIVMARIFLGEPISPLAVLGAVLIILGVMAAQRDAP